MVPSFSGTQSVAWPSALAWPLTGRRYMPPSLPTMTYDLPRNLLIVTECWSGWVVDGQSPVCFFGSMFQQGKKKFQYGPGTVHVAPPSLVSKTSSRPAYTWFGSAGSTWRNWLYQACTPGWNPGMVSAEPELLSLTSSATCVHGPNGEPDLDT